VRVEDRELWYTLVSHDQEARLSYDGLASEYAVHRRPHIGVLRELVRRTRLTPESAVLEVGCGTGNYARALAARCGCTACGLDPSAAMLSHASAHPEAAHWVQGLAEQLAFAAGSFDLIFSVDVIHHVLDRASFYRQTARTLRAGGQICTVTDSREIIIQREVLSGYFPDTVDLELARYPRIAELQAWMAAAGLQGLQVITVEEPYELTSIGPFRDRAYSSLHLIPEEAWRAGLERLEREMARGPIRGVSRYACVWGHRPPAT
jgi:ubiquinone/menaquinone biosynthesis C-methylase UbiE